MSKKSKRRQQDPPFHNPFFDQAEALSRLVAGPGDDSDAQEAPEPQGPPPAEPEPVSDEDLFWQEMQAVEPLSDSGGRVPKKLPELPRVPAASSEADEALLRQVVEEGVAFDISASAEYVEGIARGLDRRLLARLKKGAFSVQAHLDLHGMTRDEAGREVSEFLAEARRYGLRCVLIVSGRGMHSPDGRSVLRDAVVSWLTGKRLGRHVMAFCSARPHDGGLGALYVLLRK